MPIGICDLDLDAFLRGTFERVPREPALGLRVAIWIVAFAPIFVLHRASTIHGLTPSERERVVGALMVSRIYAVRQLVVALKAIGAMLYAAAPAVRARMVAPEPKKSGLTPLRLAAVNTQPAGKAQDGQRSVA